MTEAAPSLSGLWPYLRRCGVALAPDAVLAALTALAVPPVPVQPEEGIRRLVCVLARDRRDYQRLPGLIRAYLRGARAPSAEPAPPPAAAGPAVRPVGTDPDPATEADTAGGPADLVAEGEGADESDAPVGARASAQRGAGRPPLPFGDADLRRDLWRLARLLSHVPERRRGPSRRGRLDVGRTVRRSLATWGEPLHLAFRAPRRRPPHAVLLLDSSASMRPGEPFATALARQAVRRPLGAEVYAFDTELIALTGPLRRSGVGLPNLGGASWGGGTRIGACLEAYLDGPGRRLRRRSLVMILSDGWETGDPARLDRALARLARRAGRVDWLDPLAATPGYEPLSRGIMIAHRRATMVAAVGDAASFGRYVGALERVRGGDRAWRN